MGNVLIDLEAAKEYVQANYQGDPLLRHLYLTLLDALPKAEDERKIARCVDCLYRSQYSDENGMYHCGGIDTTKDHALPVVAPDFYCAYSERRLHENG